MVDTSVIVDAFLLEPHAAALAEIAKEHELEAPDHLYAEVLYALRRLERHSVITSTFAAHCVTVLVDLNLRTHSLRPLLQESWAIRHNITPYDAPFVVLAGELDCPLLTHDERLADAARDHITVQRLMPVAS